MSKGVFLVPVWFFYSLNSSILLTFAVDMTSTQTTLLPVMETFYSIQGEGEHSGRAAFFIRLGGCDVGCSWCDVKESWDADAHDKVEVAALAQMALESGAEIVIVTGGEPLMHNLNDLTFHLQSLRLKTHIETSGTHPLTGQWDWVCFSPKKFKAPLEEIYGVSDELKVVVLNKHDLLWGEDHAKKVKDDCVLYFQPEWDKQESTCPMIVNYIHDNPRWKISLQTHKFLGIR